MTEDRSVRILPEYTPEETAEINKLIEQKGHLEYLALMMVREVDKRTDLSAHLKKTDETAFKEFYGDSCDDCGCCAAEYHTIPSLLKEWQEVTDKMMGAIARRQ